MAKGTAEEIWEALKQLRSGVPANVAAKAVQRSPVTLRKWAEKYRDFTSEKQLTEELTTQDNRYVAIMRGLFERNVGANSGFEWKREELDEIAAELGVKVPKNLGDNIYSVRHGRQDLPPEIQTLAPQGKAWLLLPNGKSAYRFALADRAFLDPDVSRKAIKIPDSTPQLVAKHAKDDEQAVLARIRYCRLIDIFFGLASYQLQSHMRTTVEFFKGSQTELDEVYVGVDANGTQFVIPVQAKGDRERIGVVQIITDHYACAEKFPTMVARTVAAKTVRVDHVEGFGELRTVALIEATVDAEFNVSKVREEHYMLAPSSLISVDELESYRQRYVARR